MAEIFIQQRLYFIVFKKYSSYIFNELFPLQVGRLQEDTKRQVKGKKSDASKTREASRKCLKA